MARSFHIVAVLLACLLAAPGAQAQQATALPKSPLPLVKVWKTPSCGCCGKWVKHMEDAGFQLEVTNVDSVDPVRKANGVRPELGSCHTALVGGYFVEGHVPASDVRRLLREKPALLGITAPGMPAGSPGMDIPGSPSYDVLSVGRDGSTAVYATHASPPAGKQQDQGKN